MTEIVLSYSVPFKLIVLYFFITDENSIMLEIYHGIYVTLYACVCIYIYIYAHRQNVKI